MKLVSALAVLAFGLTCSVSAANSFAGANNYYAYSLPQNDRTVLLQGMKDAGMKVLRTWVSGHDAGQKASDNAKVNDLEWKGVGSYDDAILNQIDQLMVEAHSFGIKLLIGLYDVNSLHAGDVYAQKYGGWENFYTDGDAINMFNQRITHILNIHKNSLLGNKPWSELSAYIFGFEAMNEPMIFDQNLYTSHLGWICDSAKQIRNNVGNPNMVILTGGGSAAASVQSTFFSSSCAIDVVAIHDYNDDYDSFMPSAISQAKSAGKKLIVEEWGSLVSSGRTANLQSNVQKINSYGVPYLYWELITNSDPHQDQDYEIQVNGDDWGTIKSLALGTVNVNGAFNFTAALALS